MFHGDISNTTPFVIGVRCEGTLFNIHNSLLPFHMRLKRAEINKDVLQLVKYIYWETEMTVALIIDNKHYDKKVEKFLLDFPFGQICNVRSTNEITMLLNIGQLSYYVSNDTIDRQSVNSKFAVDFHTFDGMIRRKYKVER